MRQQPCSSNKHRQNYEGHLREWSTGAPENEASSTASASQNWWGAG